jgi:NADPH:quinone reductase-like Zn-dependent oxidoreductase
MTAIKKVLITGFGDESKLAIVEANIADPGAGEVQIQVEYTVVSGSDVNMRRGTYPFQRKAPLTPGYSIVGRVSANGAGCERFRLGERVACLTKYDGQAELINQPERYLVAVPIEADPKQAVALVLDWVTAYEMLHHAARINAGQTIFVHGLSGGVGVAFLALATLENVQVFGTASPSKQEILRKMGAVHAPFDYRSNEWISAMQAVGGADAVFDPLGYESFDRSYSILKRGGILVGYGMNLPGLSQSKRRSVLPVVLKLFLRNLAVWTGKRTTFFGLNRSSKHYLSDLELLLKWLSAAKISVPIKAVFPMKDIQAAHREYASSRGIGSIIIEVNPTALPHPRLGTPDACVPADAAPSATGTGRAPPP